MCFFTDDLVFIAVDPFQIIFFFFTDVPVFVSLKMIQCFFPVLLDPNH